MLADLAKHPVVAMVAACVVLMLVQRFLDHVKKRRKANSLSPNDLDMTVLAIAVTRSDPERVVKEAKETAARPHCLRMVVVKHLSKSEPVPEIGTDYKASTSLVLSRSKDFDASVARMQSLRKAFAGERFVCFLPGDARLVGNWDVECQKMLARGGEGAVLTSSPSRAATFLRAKEARSGTVVNDSALFAEESSKPIPSTLFSSDFAFAPSSVLAYLPPVSCVREGIEDGLVGKALWRAGFNFFTPGKALVFSEGGKRGVAPARKVTPHTFSEERTEEEYLSFVGVKGGRLTRRARLGLTPKATSFERHVKYATDDPHLLTF